MVVLELLEETNLPDSGAGYALVLGFESDFLEGDYLVGAGIPGLVYDAVRACRLEVVSGAVID